MEPQLGYWRWKIYRWNDVPNPFRGRQDLAIEWLRRVSNSGTGMPELRSLLERAGMGSRPDDKQVLEEVAARLSSGEFYVCAESGHPFHTPEFKVVPADPAAAAEEALSAMSESPAAATAASPASAPAPADPPPPPLSQPSAENTLAQNADAGAIASSLQQAAQTGAPFCEECTKVKPAASKPTQEATLSPTPAEFGDTAWTDTVDAAATARLMTRAAQEGAPYCEECEKRQKQRSETAPAATGSS